MKIQYIISKAEYDHIHSLTHQMESIMKVLRTSSLYDHDTPISEILTNIIEREKMLTAKIKELS